MNAYEKLQAAEERETPLLDMVNELMACKRDDICARAQRIIDAVEAGEAASVGLAESAAMQAVLYELFLIESAKGVNVNGRNHYQHISRIGNLHAKLAHQHKQSAAWAYRLKNPPPQYSPLGRNDKRIEKRILKRATTTADGCWDAPL